MIWWKIKIRGIWKKTKTYSNEDLEKLLRMHVDGKIDDYEMLTEEDYEEFKL